MVVLATGPSRAADLTVDGGAIYTVNSDISYYNEIVGQNSIGVINQSSFTNTVINSLTLGQDAGSSGIYNLSGGSNTVAGILFLGYVSGSSGAYNQSGGSLSTGYEFIAYYGHGVFNQSGGTNIINYNFYLGQALGVSGIYNLSSGKLFASREYVGYHGSGIFNQNGGSNTVVKKDIYSALNLGYYGNGTYNLINGSLAAPSETIGVFGSGVFNQYNGANKITDGLTIAYGLNSSGAYNLSDGKLSADSECVGYNRTGAFNQSGGSNTVTSDLVLGCHITGIGVYNLSGGTLSVVNEYIGDSGNGSFTQTGGVHSVAGNLTLASNQFGSGSLALLGGSLSVAGNYTQNAAGRLALGIASATDYSLLKVGGAATLNGRLTPVLLDYRPRGNQVYSGVITAAGGLSGAFTLTDPQIGPTLTWQPRYSANRLDLLVQRNYDNQGLGLNSNQAAVGAMLNGLAGATSGDLDTVLNAVDNLPTSGAVQDAFKQISLEKAGALTTLGFASANFQMRNLATRTTNLRFRGAGSTDWHGASPGSLGLNYSRFDGVMLAYNGTGLPSLFSARKEFKAPESRWGLFADGGAAFGSQKSTVNQAGFDFTLGGFTAGGDYRVADHLLLGLATGYSHTASGFHGSGGSVTANTVPFNAYAAYFPGSLYAYGSLGYALNLFDLERGLNFGGLCRAAKSSTTGHQFNAYGETGYDLRVWRYILTPAATLAYSRLWVGSFTEQEAGALNLQVGSQTADSLQTGLGGRLTVPFRAGQVKVAPQVYGFYEHEFANGSRGLNASLSQTGSTFNFQADAAKRNFAVVGASLNLGLQGNLWVQVNYNAEVGRGSYTAQFVNAGLRYEF